MVVLLLSSRPDHESRSHPNNAVNVLKSLHHLAVEGTHLSHLHGRTRFIFGERDLVHLAQLLPPLTAFVGEDVRNSETYET